MAIRKVLPACFPYNGSSMRTLILGSNHINTSTAWQRLELPPSTLVNSVNQIYDTGHTARHEFDCDSDLEQIMSQADKIFWAHPSPDEYGQGYYDFLEWLREYQYQYGNLTNFQDIVPDPCAWQTGHPKLTCTDAVFLGCSFTAGTGLTHPDWQYARMVSHEFGLDCVNLAVGGASNSRNFNILSQLSFVPEQLVVLQLTVPERLQYSTPDHQLHDVVLAHPTWPTMVIHRELVTVYNHAHLLHELAVSLRQFIKYARTQRLKFVFWLINYKSLDYSQMDQMCFYQYPEFIPPALIADYMVDHGTDNLHPGPESNKLISAAIIQHVRRVYNEI